MLYAILFFLFAAVVYYILRYLWELIPLGTLQNKAILITGCDPGGFGHLLALKCARKGFKVFAGCYSEQGPKWLLEALKGFEHQLFPLMLDIGEQKSVDEAFRLVKSKLLHEEVLWAVINNAGIWPSCGPHDWITIEDYKLSMNVNFYGAIRVIETFLPLLKQSSGRIITVSSVAARIAEPGCCNYSCAKQELRETGSGITCCIVEPGRFKTKIASPETFRERFNAAWQRLSPELKAEYGPGFVEKYVAAWTNALNWKFSPRVDYVVDNYYHAITARFPRLRYRCGWDAVFYLVPMSFLPTEILDWIIKQDI